jgi:hypothetical protein
MWFDHKKGLASLYKHETDQRLFAMASGRRTARECGSEAADEESRGRWLAERWTERWTRWLGQAR